MLVSAVSPTMPLWEGDEPGLAAVPLHVLGLYTLNTAYGSRQFPVSLEEAYARVATLWASAPAVAIKKPS